MGKSEIQALEATVHEAFLAAQGRRREIGLPQLKPTTGTVKRGPNKGLEYIAGYNGRPMKYRVTTWWESFEYADLLRLREHLGFRGSPATLLIKLVRERLPGRVQAARPRPLPRAPLAERLKLRPGHGRRAA